MKTYFFDLLAQEGWIIDRDGTSLPGVHAGLEHASTVARELMKGAERSRRHWRLRMRDEKSAGFGELLFASVDPTLDHVTPPVRTVIENVSWQLGELVQMVIRLDRQRYEYRAFWARLNRRPFLVAIGDRRVASIPAVPDLPATNGPNHQAARVGLRTSHADRLASVKNDRITLLKAEQHIAEGEKHVVRQRALIAALEQKGADATESKRLLALFEGTLALHVNHRNRLARAMSHELAS
jgi:hypothetical protein